MFCANCGCKVNDRDSFCGTCGFKLNYKNSAGSDNSQPAEKGTLTFDSQSANQNTENQSTGNASFSYNNSNDRDPNYEYGDRNYNSTDNSYYSNQNSGNNNSYYGGDYEKSKIAAGLLAIFLGALGIHKFYLGYTREGIITLVISLVGSLLCGLGPAVMGIIAIIEGITYLTKTDNQFYDTYVVNEKGWF